MPGTYGLARFAEPHPDDHGRQPDPDANADAFADPVADTNSDPVADPNSDPVANADAFADPVALAHADPVAHPTPIPSPTPTPTPIPNLGGTLHDDGKLTARNEVVVADVTNCYVSCSFDWSVDGVDAGTTVDDVAGDAQGQIAGELRSRPAAVGFFNAQSQLAHVFTVGSHVVSVTVTDEMQRTITLDLELEVAAADLGKPPETDTIGNAPIDVMPQLPFAGYLIVVGLLSLVAGLQASRRSR